MHSEQFKPKSHLKVIKSIYFPKMNTEQFQPNFPLHPGCATVYRQTSTSSVTGALPVERRRLCTSPPYLSPRCPPLSPPLSLSLSLCQSAARRLGRVPAERKADWCLRAITCLNSRAEGPLASVRVTCLFFILLTHSANLSPSRAGKRFSNITLTLL